MPVVAVVMVVMVATTGVMTMPISKQTEGPVNHTFQSELEYVYGAYSTACIGMSEKASAVAAAAPS